MNYLKNHVLTRSLVPTLFFLLAACSSTVSKDNRDTSGKYDGIWNAEVQTAQSPQRVHNWQFQCNDLSRTIKMSVKEGEVNMVLGKEIMSTYLGEDGNFQFKLPGGKLESGVGWSSSAPNRNVTIFIRGKLDGSPGKGSLVIGFAEVGYAGCTSKIRYQRA